MARPIPQWQRPIVAKWLQDTRLRQRRELDDEPWTHDDLLADIERTMGKVIHRPNYSRYENKGSMEPATLKLFVDYWAKKKEPGPALVPPSAAEPELPPLDLALKALVHELTTARLEREALKGEVAQLRAMMNRLIGGNLAPGGTSAPATPPSPGQ